MRALTLIAALALAGCASTYQLTVMPRDSGKLYTGVADDNGSGEGHISITIEDKTYSGTWVETRPSTTTGYVGGGVGWGWGWHGRGAMGGYVTMDNPEGGAAKALLNAPDGSGLRCDFVSGYGRGGGMCADDKGRAYDVQVRRAASK
ncbi:MAG: hypothetical protein ACXWBQ_18305 [Usitatibacter sp.]